MWGWLLKLSPLAPKLGVPPIAVKIAQWVAAESEFLKPRWERWQKLLPPGEGGFDGPGVKAAIETYEPTAYEMAVWYKKEEKFLAPRIAKWRALFGGGKPSFDGAAVKAFFQKWEPIAYEAAELHLKQGKSLKMAVYTAWMNTAGPRPDEF